MHNIDVKNIRPLTDFRNKMKEYMEELNRTKKPIVLTQHGKSAAVLVDADAFQEMQEQLKFFSKVAKGLEDYKNHRTHSLKTTFDEIDVSM